LNHVNHAHGQASSSQERTFATQQVNQFETDYS
jgi:hypothetical protein